MTKISGRLTDDIDMKLTTLQGSDRYTLKRADAFKKSLIKMGDLYSLWMEFPQERRALLGSDNKREIKKIAKQGLEDIQKAWKILIYKNEKLEECLDKNLIIELGSAVEPGNYGFRNGAVTLGLKNYVPPNCVKIPSLIEEMIKDIKIAIMPHPIELAAYLHLRVAGIQPFFDGNKRVARLLQNKVLYDHNLPPAVIHPGEREVYIDLLEDALVGYQEDSIKKQRPFFDYIGGKVNSALDDMLDDLKL